MKLEKFTNAVILAALLVLTWCVTPPNLSSLTVLIGKVIFTFIAIAFYSSNYTTLPDKFSQLIKTGFHLITRFFSLLRNLASRFIAWICELDDINRVVRLCEGSHFRDKWIEPIPTFIKINRHICILSLTFSVLFTTFYADCAYHRSYTGYLALFILFLVYFYPVHVIRKFISKNYYTNDNIIFWFTNAIELIVLILSALDLEGAELAFAELEWYFQPYFRLTLSFGTFDLTPIRLFTVVAALITLIAYSRLCSAVHSITTLPIYSESWLDAKDNNEEEN